MLTKTPPPKPATAPTDQRTWTAYRRALIARGVPVRTAMDVVSVRRCLEEVERGELLLQFSYRDDPTPVVATFVLRPEDR